jgi:glutaredoxin-related protein
MWTGWPTMPIIFIHGVLIGGYEDLKRLAEADESVFKVSR